jgi:hypothetical protein
MSNNKQVTYEQATRAGNALRALDNGKFNTDPDSNDELRDQLRRVVAEYYLTSGDSNRDASEKPSRKAAATSEEQEPRMFDFRYWGGKKRF